MDRLVYSSSCAVYGTPSDLPVRETSALQPENAYGETKLLVERGLRWLRDGGLRAVNLRYFNAAGAALDGRHGEDWTDAPNLVPVVIKATLGYGPPVRILGSDYPTPDGSAIRDYVHVADLADAHVRAVEAVGDGLADAALNLGTGVGSSVREVIAAVRPGRRARGPDDRGGATPRRPGGDLGRRVAGRAGARMAGRTRSRDDRRQRVALARQPPGRLRADRRGRTGCRTRLGGATVSAMPRPDDLPLEPAPLDPPAASATAPLRVAYVMSRFPKLTETFILFEMLGGGAPGRATSAVPAPARARGDDASGGGAVRRPGDTTCRSCRCAILASQWTCAASLAASATSAPCRTIDRAARWRSPNFLVGGLGDLPEGRPRAPA